MNRILSKSKLLLGLGLGSLLGALTLIPIALAQNLTEQGSQTASQTTTGLSDFFTTIWMKAPSWIAAMVVFAVSFIAAKMVKNSVLDKVADKFGEEDQDILVLIGRATYVGVLGLGVTIALAIAGIDLTAIIAAVGFGIGFALQDLIMNFIAGIMILVNRQFTINDFIKVNDTIGQVVEIQSRSTILKALDGTRVIVPNADLFTNQVTSFTSNPFRRIEVGVGVEYRTDLSQASQAIREALNEHAKVLRDPAPAIILDEFADSSINFLVRFWVESRAGWVGIRSDVIQLIKKHFDEEGIGIPFPIRTLAFDRDTEDVVMPVYQVPQTEMQAHMAERAKAEEMLSSQVEAAHERAEKMQDIQPPKPEESDAPSRVSGENEPEGAAFFDQNPAPAPAKAETEEEEPKVGAAIEGADDEEEHEETPIIPTVPKAELEDGGASFLRSEAEQVEMKPATETVSASQ